MPIGPQPELFFSCLNQQCLPLFVLLFLLSLVIFFFESFFFVLITSTVSRMFSFLFLTWLWYCCIAVWSFITFLGNCEEELPKKPVGRLSADCRPSVGRLSAVCRPSVGRLSAVCRPSVGRLSADCRPSVGRLLAVCRPTNGRQVFPKT